MAMHTVRELKDALAFIPDDVVVWVDGCDCTNPWDGLVMKQDESTVILGRELI